MDHCKIIFTAMTCEIATYTCSLHEVNYTFLVASSVDV